MILVSESHRAMTMKRFSISVDRKAEANGSYDDGWTHSRCGMVVVVVLMKSTLIS